MSGVLRITRERARQIEDEGYTPEHDAGHAGELTEAASSYTHYAEAQIYSGMTHPYGDNPLWTPRIWPWKAEDWKPSTDPKKNLEKAGALIAAAIDSLEAEA